jgi:hypothetical protein
MGTRADFYVGRGAQAEWLGSIAWDGYPDGVFDDDFAPASCATAEQWREKVAAFLASRDDATLPEQGWPWPWDDSRTTDYAYAFDGDAVWSSAFGHEWFRVDPAAEYFGEPVDESERDIPKNAVFPNMAERKNVTYGPRSGVIVFRV